MKRGKCLMCVCSGVVVCLVAAATALPKVARADSTVTISGNSYYEVYGAPVGDYSLTTHGHTLLGTSNGGTTFDVSHFGRFILYIPSGSGRILFDAIGLDDHWVESQPGPEYAHYTSNLNPTNCSWTQCGDWYIEGPPDGKTIENGVGRDAYYGFSTLGATAMTVYLQGASTGTHDVALTAFSASPTSVTRGQTVTFTGTVKNNGNVSESGVKFTMTTNGQQLRPPVALPTLTAGQQVSGSLKMKVPLTASKGEYLITGTLSTVTGETNTANNSMTVKVVVK
ncbi:MAG: hypothetical protein GW893_14685 [Armatimonadetes bacterium]|nr:hypothetical protein [Armatimonadota bacterium]PIU61963.1 MAG: hypothetical protein COS85_19910 [Armatimonadetes bacterium CG07_land_8_20_14_0_80_59_28]PJB62596.1 MAG: hypothetical protein CO095_18200 [Armatimonadetes bacterium CG_4_9_14_3_um_filter_58_7]